MSKRSFAVFLQVTAISLFIVLATALIFFADGYLYDSKAKDFVKNGLVSIDQFDSVDTAITIDGEPINMTLSGEIRITPGKHLISISRPGYYSWTKNLVVPENNVLNFKKIRLLPRNFENEIINDIDSSVEWRVAASLPNGLFLFNDDIHVGKFFPYSSPDRMKVFELKKDDNRGSALMDLNGELLDGYIFVTVSNDRIWAIDKDLNLWRFDGKKESAKMMFKLSQLSEVSNPPFDSSIISSNDYIAITNRKKNNKLWIYNMDGDLLYSAQNAAGSFFDGKIFYYIQNNRLISYDLDRDLILNQAKMGSGSSIKWLSPIENTYHMLVLMGGGELNYCDRDLENCSIILNDQKEKIYSAKENNIFITFNKGKIILLDFRANGKISRFLRGFAN